MKWLYILLCAYQFISKYRCLKAIVIQRNFLGNDMSKNMHYTCIALKNRWQIYFKKCKCKTFQNTELKSDSDWESSDSESSNSHSESDSEPSDPDSDSGLGNLCFSYSVFN